MCPLVQSLYFCGRFFWCCFTGSTLLFRIALGRRRLGTALLLYIAPWPALCGVRCVPRSILLLLPSFLALLRAASRHQLPCALCYWLGRCPLLSLQ